VKRDADRILRRTENLPVLAHEAGNPVLFLFDPLDMRYPSVGCLRWYSIDC
jgi:hypothetical protein